MLFRSRLGVYESGGRLYSRTLEFFGQLVNADLSPVPLPTAPIDEVLSTTRIIFGSETIEYRLPTQTRFGAMLGIKEYASPTTVGMYNVLLSAPSILVGLFIYEILVAPLKGFSGFAGAVGSTAVSRTLAGRLRMITLACGT
mgnify:CR=1 FL=1